MRPGTWETYTKEEQEKFREMAITTVYSLEDVILAYEMNDKDMKYTEIYTAQVVTLEYKSTFISTLRIHTNCTKEQAIAAIQLELDRWTNIYETSELSFNIGGMQKSHAKQHKGPWRRE